MIEFLNKVYHNEISLFLRGLMTQPKTIVILEY